MTFPPNKGGRWRSFYLRMDITSIFNNTRKLFSCQDRLNGTGDADDGDCDDDPLHVSMTVSECILDCFPKEPHGDGGIRKKPRLDPESVRRDRLLACSVIELVLASVAPVIDHSDVEFATESPSPRFSNNLRVGYHQPSQRATSPIINGVLSAIETDVLRLQLVTSVRSSDYPTRRSVFRCLELLFIYDLHASSSHNRTLSILLEHSSIQDVCPILAANCKYLRKISEYPEHGPCRDVVTTITAQLCRAAQSLTPLASDLPRWTSCFAFLTEFAKLGRIDVNDCEAADTVVVDSKECLKRHLNPAVDAMVTWDTAPAAAMAAIRFLRAVLTSQSHQLMQELTATVLPAWSRSVLNHLSGAPVGDVDGAVSFSCVDPVIALAHSLQLGFQVLRKWRESRALNARGSNVYDAVVAGIRRLTSDSTSVCQHLFSLLRADDAVMLSCLSDIQDSVLSSHRCRQDADDLDGLLSTIFDPHRLFLLFADEINSDHVTLIDLLSDSDSALEYVLGYLNYSLLPSATRPSGVQDALVSRALPLITQARLAIERAVSVEAWPFNATPLIRKMELFEANLENENANP